MIIETNLIDLGKITFKNYNTYNEKIKYEIPRQWGIRNKKTKKKKQYKTEDARKKHLKQYQHEYYLRVTKPRREAKRSDLSE